jgi:hypothetical protein
MDNSIGRRFANWGGVTIMRIAKYTNDIVVLLPDPLPRERNTHFVTPWPAGAFSSLANARIADRLYHAVGCTGTTKITIDHMT